MIRKIWPINKIYCLLDEIEELKKNLCNQDDALNESEKLIKLLIQKQDNQNDILNESEKLIKSLIQKQDNQNDILDENEKLLKLLIQKQDKNEIISQQLEKKYRESLNAHTNQYEKEKNEKNEDLWLTKYGYDWIMSDLQLAQIEQLVPGNRARLESFKDSHKGEKCFVIGNGPSLKAVDLTYLKDNGIFCFGSKRINLIFDQTEWRPDIWGVSDLDFIKMYKDEISSLCSFPKFVCAQSILRNNIFIKDAIYYPFIQMERNPPWFNHDICRGVHFWGTITCKLINFAVYMGFKEIYLLGVDNSYPIKKTIDGMCVLDSAAASHFIDNYQAVDEVDCVNENIDNIMESLKYINDSYSSIKWHCDQENIKIFNATRGGELDIFPRVSLEDVLGIENK